MRCERTEGKGRASSELFLISAQILAFHLDSLLLINSIRGLALDYRVTSAPLSVLSQESHRHNKLALSPTSAEHSGSRGWIISYHSTPSR